MTAISLFHRPTFEHRIYIELAPEQSSALLASMFSFSARHIESNNGARRGTLNPARFYELASDTVHKQLRKCDDGPPPLSLLQTLIITTFYELVSCVQRVAWRLLGALIRIAYELRLHLVDLPSRPTLNNENPEPVEKWIAKEERRRAWWAIWEFEVFVTTIRRCPLGIHPSQHTTLLPVDDALWFKGQKSPSCFLEADPALRWKELQNSGNDSGKAWFIVINSLMRDAHCLSNPSVPSRPCAQDEDRHYRNTNSEDRQQINPDSEISLQLAILDNCVSCFSIALPQRLRYRSELLFAPSTTSTESTTQRRDSDKITIHVMIQLAKIMILHKDCFRNDSQALDQQLPEQYDYNNTSAAAELPTNSDRTAATSSAVWSRYLHAAENVVSSVRNASPDILSYGHPLLVNTFWMVAAIQIVQKTFAKTRSEKLVAQSNFDLLRLTIMQHGDYWSSPAVRIQNLERLESTLSAIRARMLSGKHTKKDRLNTTAHPPEEEIVSYSVSPKHRKGDTANSN